MGGLPAAPLLLPLRRISRLRLFIASVSSSTAAAAGLHLPQRISKFRRRTTSYATASVSGDFARQLSLSSPVSPAPIPVGQSVSVPLFSHLLRYYFSSPSVPRSADRSSPETILQHRLSSFRRRILLGGSALALATLLPESAKQNEITYSYSHD